MHEDRVGGSMARVDPNAVILDTPLRPNQTPAPGQFWYGRATCQRTTTWRRDLANPSSRRGETARAGVGIGTTSGTRRRALIRVQLPALSPRPDNATLVNAIAEALQRGCTLRKLVDDSFSARRDQTHQIHLLAALKPTFSPGVMFRIARKARKLLASSSRNAANAWRTGANATQQLDQCTRPETSSPLRWDFCDIAPPCAVNGAHCGRRPIRGVELRWADILGE